MTNRGETERMEATAATRPVTGGRVLAYLAAFFGVVIAANLALVTLAIDTLPGVEVDSAYRASLAFNAEAAAAQAQAARGWRVAAHVERDADGGARVRIEARDKAGAPLGGVAFSAWLARPTDRREDRAVALNEREAGLFVGAAAPVGPGQWDLVIEGTRGAERLYRSRNRVLLN